MILAYQGIGFISRRIRAVTRGRYSHIAWQQRDGRVIEAWGTGCGFLRYLATGKGPDGELRRVANAHVQHTPGTVVDVFSFDGLEIHREYIEELLLRDLGGRYDYRGVLSCRTHDEAADPQAWFCSEWVHAAVLRAGVQLQNRPSHQVDPSWLAASPLLRLEDSFITRPADQA